MRSPEILYAKELTTYLLPFLPMLFWFLIQILASRKQAYPVLENAGTFIIFIQLNFAYT